MKLTKKEKEIILISLIAMRDQYAFLRGFGLESKGEKFIRKLIEKITKI